LRLLFRRFLRPVIGNAAVIRGIAYEGPEKDEEEEE